MKNLRILSLVLILVSCSKTVEKESADNSKTKGLAETQSHPESVVLTDEQLKAIKIQLGRLEKRQMTNTVKANGMLDVPPQNLVTISAPLGGFVKYTELLQGMKVNKGQVLVILEHPDYIQMQQDYLESKSQLEFFELEYNRQKDLASENVNAVKTLEQSKSNYFITKAKMGGLKEKLKLININPKDIETGEIKSSISIPAPISGYVTQVNINIGMHVNPTEVMFKIVDTGHLHAEAQVFEKDISKLAVGQLVRIRLSNEGKERLAHVYLIGKEITHDRTVRIHCHLDIEDQSLIPGMYFSATIETEETSVQVLPREAIVTFEGNYFIFAATNGDIHRYEVIEISKGNSDDRYTEAEFPESLQDRQIVVKGSYDLLGILKNKEE